MRLLETKKLSLQEIIDKMSYAPRTILNLPELKIEEGADANLTFFNTDEKWIFNEKNVRSKSRNSPYLNTELIGRAVGIYNRGELVLNTLK